MPFIRSILILPALLALPCLARQAQAQTERIRRWEGQAGLIQPGYPFGEIGELFRKPFHSQYLAGLQWQKAGVRFFTLTYGARTGLQYHRFIQWGIPVQGNVGLRMSLYQNLGLEGSLIGGYLHSFPLTQAYTFKNGEYRRSGKLGRPQAQLGLELGPTVGVGKGRYEVFLHYQFWLQLPYIKSYVPALPYNGLTVGLRWGQENATKPEGGAK